METGTRAAMTPVAHRRVIAAAVVLSAILIAAGVPWPVLLVTAVAAAVVAYAATRLVELWWK
jgi:hypothetical protein